MGIKTNSLGKTMTALSIVNSANSKFPHDHDLYKPESV